MAEMVLTPPAQPEAPTSPAPEQPETGEKQQQQTRQEKPHPARQLVDKVKGWLGKNGNVDTTLREVADEPVTPSETSAEQNTHPTAEAPQRETTPMLAGPEDAIQQLRATEDARGNPRAPEVTSGYDKNQPTVDAETVGKHRAPDTDEEPQNENSTAEQTDTQTAKQKFIDQISPPAGESTQTASKPAEPEYRGRHTAEAQAAKTENTEAPTTATEQTAAEDLAETANEQAGQNTRANSEPKISPSRLLSQNESDALQQDPTVIDADTSSSNTTQPPTSEASTPPVTPTVEASVPSPNGPTLYRFLTLDEIKARDRQEAELKAQRTQQADALIKKSFEDGRREGKTDDEIHAQIQAELTKTFLIPEDLEEHERGRREQWLSVILTEAEKNDKTPAEVTDIIKELAIQPNTYEALHDTARAISQQSENRQPLDKTIQDLKQQATNEKNPIVRSRLLALIKILGKILAAAAVATVVATGAAGLAMTQKLGGNSGH